MTKLLIIGLDGATFDLIKPWAAEGKLPTLAKLMQDGVTGNLESTLPPVTSPAWPTFMTGKNPGKHGVFDFIRPRAGTFDMVNASQIKGKLLWEILSEAGYSVGVLNVPITYPPRKVNGYMVPGLLSPDQGKTVYPPDLLKPYEAELGKYRLTPNVQYKAGNEDEFIADLHDLIDTQLRYALRLMKDHPTDVLMLHFLATDNGSHALWRFMDQDASAPRSGTGRQVWRCAAQGVSTSRRGCAASARGRPAAQYDRDERSRLRAAASHHQPQHSLHRKRLDAPQAQVLHADCAGGRSATA